MHTCIIARTIAIAAISASGLIAVGAITGSAEAQQPIACGQDYRVVSGDTLSTISDRAYGPGQTQSLFNLNRDRIGPNPNVIELDTLIRIPCNLAGVQAVAPRTSAEPEPQANFLAIARDNRAGAAADDEGSVTAIFTPAPVPQTPPREAIFGGEALVEVVFNKAAAPQYILNVEVIDPYLADIERVTNGRVRFVEPAEPNRDPTAQLDLVLSGEADAAYVFNGHLAESHPLLQITMQPMIGGTGAQTALALWRVQEGIFAKAQEFQGVQLLGFVGGPPAHIWRAPDAPLMAQDKLVANNPWGANQLGTGETESFALAHGSARALGIWNQGRAVTEIDGGVYAPTFSVFIRNEVWAQIPPADQAAIMAISGEALAARSAAWDAFEARQRAEMLAGGLDIREADLDLLAELQDRARITWEQWIARADREGISGFKALDQFFAEMRRLKEPS